MILKRREKKRFRRRKGAFANNESFRRLEVSTINCQDRYLETEEGLGFEELNNNTKGVDLEDNKEV